MCAYFILYQTEFIKRKNRLKCGESSRSIVNNKGEDMKRISQHFGSIADFSYIADTTRRDTGCACRLVRSGSGAL